MIGIAAAFGCDDPRLDEAFGWLLGQQLDDGGWNCETVRSGSAHGPFNTTILALEALDEWERSRGADPDVAAAASRGREFFCAHRLSCAHPSATRS